MLRTSPNSPGVSLYQTHGLLLPSAPFDQLSAMPKTSGNALTLLLTDPPSSLSATNTTSSSCLPKRVLLQPWCIFSLRQPQRLWQTVNKFLHYKSSSQLLTTSPGASLDSVLFLTGKVSKLRLFFTSNPAASSPHSPPPPATPLKSRALKLQEWAMQEDMLEVDFAGVNDNGGKRRRWTMTEWISRVE